jgi:hypothetical protein
MLKPSKHLDLDRSVLRVSSEILRELQKRRVINYETVLRIIKSRTSDDADVVVAPALNFLYLVGRIEYHAKNDTFEYLETSRDRQ